MKAVCWNGINDVSVMDVPDPKILSPGDVIVRITSTAICGSDLHLYDGYVPSMMPGDILGHEFMGEVVEVGREVRKFRVGDRVIVPFTIACGHCWFCEHDLWSLCDNTNPNGAMQEQVYGFATSGLFGYSHLFGGYAGGQAEYARVPFADHGPMKVPDSLSDDQVLFLSDIYPTGYMAAENCDIKPGDTIAVWGCGPVGQFAIRSAFMLGADRVIAIDRIPERLEMAREAGAEVMDYEDGQLYERLREATGGRGPDAVIDAVGMEAHGHTAGGVYDRAKHLVRLGTDRPTALREAMLACRKGGTVSVPGVYGGLLDKMPFGAAFNKGLSFKMGQTHVQRYLPRLLESIERGAIDPSFVITHRLPLEQAPWAYETFKHKRDRCIKVVLKPGTHPVTVHPTSAVDKAEPGIAVTPEVNP